MAAIIAYEHVLAARHPVHTGLDRLSWPIQRITRVPRIQPGAGDADMVGDRRVLLAVHRLRETLDRVAKRSPAKLSRLALKSRLPSTGA